MVTGVLLSFTLVGLYAKGLVSYASAEERTGCFVAATVGEPTDRKTGAIAFEKREPLRRLGPIVASPVGHTLHFLH